jgi:multiple sugar transport system permease protein
MSTTTLPPLETEPVVAVQPRRRGRRRYSRNRLAYGLIAPAVAFMVLVHVMPMAGGVWLSFKNLNTFTFAQLWGAPWAGLGNYDAILFDAGNPLRSGFLGAVQNTAVYTFWTVAGTLGGGSSTVRSTR